MSLTRICDLPEMRYDDTQDTDILVIENKIDTYKIPLGDLKILFGSDAKLQAIYDSLIEKINKVIDQVEQLDQKTDSDSSSVANIIQVEQLDQKTDSDSSSVANIIVQLRESINRNTRSITVMQNTLNSIETRLSQIDTSISDLTTTVNSINAAVEKNHSEITSIKNTVNQHSKDITQLKSFNTTISATVDQMNKEIDDLNETIKNMNAVSTDTLDTIRTELMETINDRYEEIMNIIDEHFHCPPLLA